MSLFADPLGGEKSVAERYGHEYFQESFHKADGEGCPYRSDDIMAPEKGVSTGTTIMAVEFDGGVIMGADSRTSMGDYIANRVSRKITPVHENIYVCRSGSAADTQALTTFVKHYLSQHAIELDDPKYPRVSTAATLFKMLAYQNKDHLLAGLIVAGWDREEGGQVYNIPLGGALLRKGVAVGGSGSGFILGLIDNDYRPGMTETETRALVKKWISHAMARDGSSGGVIRTMTIKKEGVFEDFTPGDKLPYGPL